MKKFKARLRRGTLFAACIACMPALATEGGGSMYPNGLENYVAGALPPPGLYGLLYATHYSADRLMDNSGNQLNVPGFKVSANMAAPRLVWLPGLNSFKTFDAIHTWHPATEGAKLLPPPGSWCRVSSRPGWTTWR